MRDDVRELARRVADVGTTVRTLQAELESGEFAESESLHRVIRAAKHLQARLRGELATAARIASQQYHFPDDERTVVDALPYQETT